MPPEGDPMTKSWFSWRIGTMFQRWAAAQLRQTPIKHEQLGTSEWRMEFAVVGHIANVALPVIGGVLFGTADAICAQLAKRLLLMGKRCYHHVGLPLLISNPVGGLSMITPLSEFLLLQPVRQARWLDSKPSSWVAEWPVSVMAKIRIGWDGGGWAMTGKANKQMHLEYTCVFLTWGTYTSRQQLPFWRLFPLNDWLPFIREIGKAEKLIDTKTPWELRMLRKFGIIEDDPNIFLPLRRMREDWLLRNIQTAAWMDEHQEAERDQKQKED